MGLSKDWITGFVEGEGSFIVALKKQKASYGFRICPEFKIEIHQDDKEILKKIKMVLGVGEVSSPPILKQRKHVRLYVGKLRDCLTIKKFFENGEFHTTKERDFVLWSNVIELVQSKAHLKPDGIIQICKIRDQMNTDIKIKQATYRTAKEVRLYFKSKFNWKPSKPLILEEREEIQPKLKNKNLTKDWLIGFIEAEGSLTIGIGKLDTARYGLVIRPSFQLFLHKKEKPTLENIKNFINIGVIEKRSKAKEREKGSKKTDLVGLRCQGITSCLKLRDFFDDCSFHSEKRKTFELWSECLDILQLRSKGAGNRGSPREKNTLLKICRLRDQMNNKTRSKTYRTASAIEFYLKTNYGKVRRKITLDSFMEAI